MPPASEALPQVQNLPGLSQSPPQLIGCCCCDQILTGSWKVLSVSVCERVIKTGSAVCEGRWVG